MFLTIITYSTNYTKVYFKNPSPLRNPLDSSSLADPHKHLFRHDSAELLEFYQTDHLKMIMK